MLLKVVQNDLRYAWINSLRCHCNPIFYSDSITNMWIDREWPPFDLDILNDYQD